MSAPGPCANAEFDPSTLVVCDPSGDTDCRSNTCAPVTGLCAPADVAAGTACEDGSDCTTGDACQAGVCTPAHSGLDEPNPRTNGYYKRLCQGPHSGDQLTDADAACVASISSMKATTRRLVAPGAGLALPSPFGHIRAGVLATVFAFLLVAPLPLQLHLGHPERSLEMYLTPHTESAMAMFGFVYLWYLMVVLVLEIWLDYRKDIVLMARRSTGLTRQMYRAMALWSDNISERSLEVDDKVGRFITIVGIPSAFLLHGYVGFIFGSLKANPWWSSGAGSSPMKISRP